ncbi:hypothetical protein D3C87_1484410 [compost metagenome]
MRKTVARKSAKGIFLTSTDTRADLLKSSISPNTEYPVCFLIAEITFCMEISFADMVIVCALALFVAKNNAKINRYFAVLFSNLTGFTGHRNGRAG